MAYLGVNIDHVATIREARKTIEPDPLQAAFLAELAGCHSITVHLREDERHIKKEDVYELRKKVRTKLNLEMALREDLVDFALELKPDSICFVPEKRQEITTESGFLASSHQKSLEKSIPKLKQAGIQVSIFIDPIEEEIRICSFCKANQIELHTGSYAEAPLGPKRSEQLEKLITASALAHKLSLVVNAGHGLTYFNILPLVKKIKSIYEFNIGHSIISRSVLVGIEKAVKDMLFLLKEA